MVTITNIDVRVVTNNNDSGYKHRKLVEEIHSIGRGSWFDSVSYSYNSERGDEHETEIEMVIVTEDSSKDRKHRKCVDSIVEAVNDTTFDVREIESSTKKDAEEFGKGYDDTEYLDIDSSQSGASELEYK